MSELRKDPLTDRWVIVAPVRGDRPEELLETPAINRNLAPCPFCAGNEDSTPDPTLVVPSHNDTEWSVRVVPNKYPAINAANSRWQSHHPNHPLFESQQISGGHEVIIESPLHLQSFSELQPDQAITVFQCYAERLRYWFAQKDIVYAIVFKNVGAAAGASLSHLHSQLMATCIEPNAIAMIGNRLATYRRQMGNCLLCDLIQEERTQSQRVVVASERLIAFCPFASYLPYLIRVAPLDHQDAFEEQGSSSLAEAGLLLRRLVKLLENIYRGAAYNFVLQTRPARSGGPASFHWWIDLFPRVSKLAGFEWGTGVMINPVAPEVAAAQLRQLDRRQNIRQHAEDFSG